LVGELLQAAGDDRLALVGGAVRDWLLHRVHNDPWRGVPDLDLVVEPADGVGAVPAAHRLARALRAALGAERMPFYQEHPAYGTVELEVRRAEGPLLLDIASARRETYPVPGENPLVSFGQLEDDLARRDFTINAMALRLEVRGGGDLHDPHGGRGDLEQRQLRFLHPDSVRDDPTRVLRGARYAARLGFRLAPEAQAQLDRTLESWPWAWRPGDPPAAAPSALGTRLRMELELLLEREAWPRALAALQAWGGLRLLDGALQDDGQWRRRLRWAGRLQLPLLPALLAGAAEPLALAERLQVPHRHHQLLAQFLRLRSRLAQVDGEGLPPDPAQWCALLEAPGTAPEAIALALACAVGPRRPLLRWWLLWRHLQGGAQRRRADGGGGHRAGPRPWGKAPPAAPRPAGAGEALRAPTAGRPAYHPQRLPSPAPP
jgi:poly(A) polymerase